MHIPLQSICEIVGRESVHICYVYKNTHAKQLFIIYIFFRMFIPCIGYGYLKFFLLGALQLYIIMGFDVTYSYIPTIEQCYLLCRIPQYLSFPSPPLLPWFLSSILSPFYFHKIPPDMVILVKWRWGVSIKRLQVSGGSSCPLCFVAFVGRYPVFTCLEHFHQWPWPVWGELFTQHFTLLMSGLCS